MTKAAAATIDMVSVIENRRPMTSILKNNTPGQEKRGIKAGKLFATTTVTGSLVQKTVTADGGNQGSCDKNPGKAASTSDTDAIVEENDAILGSIRGTMVLKEEKMVKVQLIKGNSARQKSPWPKPNRCAGYQIRWM
jgi:hypothetical protein